MKRKLCRTRLYWLNDEIQIVENMITLLIVNKWAQIVAQIKSIYILPPW